MSEDIKVGDIVNVTIKGVRNVGHPSARLRRIADEHGDVFDMPPQAKVERVASAFWPPRTGDKWADDRGFLYFGLQPRCPDGAVDLVDVSGRKVRAAVLLRQNPVLVHREDEQPW